MKEILNTVLRPAYRYLLFQKSKINIKSIEDKRNSLFVYDSWDTIEYINRHRCSISRFGDGELDLVLAMKYGSGFHSNFQDFNSLLARRLAEILDYSNPVENHIVGLPACAFGYGTSKFKWNIAEYWNRYTYNHIDKLLEITNKKHEYIDTNFTRFYMDYKRHDETGAYVMQLKTLWQDRDVVLVEGEKTRLGMGNDLFSSAKTISRILCPSQNAFDRYDDILGVVMEHTRPGDLVIVALGMTATVLAYDLAEAGIQTLDMGHVDIEYEWYRMGAKKKVDIQGKYTNESSCGRRVEKAKDAEYLSQIVDEVL